jgi:hypothetical protein
MNIRFLLLLLLIAGCGCIVMSCADDEDGPVAPISEIRNSCEGCHTDEEALIATALPDTTTHENGGEG